MKRRPIWITSESQRRNRELSRALGATLFEFSEIDGMAIPFTKYARGALRTIMTLLRTAPPLVFCQNPSIVLSLLLVCLRPVFRFRLCVDAHYDGIFPCAGKSLALSLLSRFIQRQADLTLATNEKLRAHVHSHRGRAFVLPDKTPSIPAAEVRYLRGASNLLFICSYAPDEPFAEVCRAATFIDPHTFIYVTGNHARAGVRPEHLPPNVVLIGFIPEEDYVAMLHSVGATIDLTTREDCLVCGAYETLALGKPMILSDTAALRAYFSQGVVYTQNTAEGIARAIAEVIESKASLSAAACNLRAVRSGEWERRKTALSEILGLDAGEPARA